MSKVILFLVIVFMISCQGKNKDYRNSSIERGPNWILRSVDSVEIYINDQTSVQGYVQLVRDNDREYIVSFQSTKNENNFHFYNLLTKKYYKTISFQMEGGSGVGKLSPFATFNSFSEILLYQANGNRFFIGDSSGIVSRKIDLRDHVSGTIYPQPSYPSKIIDDKLYFFLMAPINPNDRDFFKNAKAEGVFDLLKSNLSNTFPSYPDYPDGIENTMDSWKVSRCIGANGEFVYSFPFDNKLYVIENGSKKEFNIPNNQFHVSDIEGLDVTNLESQMKIIGRFGVYTYLYFDPFRKFYYRIYLTPGPEKDLNGKLIMIGERGFKIEIINEKFELVGWSEFKSKEFSPYCLLISKDGILLSRLNPHAPQVEDKFVFERFELVKR